MAFGRKVCVADGSDRGGERVAGAEGLVATAKLNANNSYAWLAGAPVRIASQSPPPRRAHALALVQGEHVSQYNGRMNVAQTYETRLLDRCRRDR